MYMHLIQQSRSVYVKRIEKHLVAELIHLAKYLDEFTRFTDS